LTEPKKWAGKLEESEPLLDGGASDFGQSSFGADSAASPAPPTNDFSSFEFDDFDHADDPEFFEDKKPCNLDPAFGDVLTDAKMMITGAVSAVVSPMCFIIGNTGDMVGSASCYQWNHAGLFFVFLAVMMALFVTRSYNQGSHAATALALLTPIAYMSVAGHLSLHQILQGGTELTNSVIANNNASYAIVFFVVAFIVWGLFTHYAPSTRFSGGPGGNIAGSLILLSTCISGCVAGMQCAVPVVPDVTQIPAYYVCGCGAAISIFMFLIPALLIHFRPAGLDRTKFTTAVYVVGAFGTAMTSFGVLWNPAGILGSVSDASYLPGLFGLFAGLFVLSIIFSYNKDCGLNVCNR